MDKLETNDLGHINKTMFLTLWGRYKFKEFLPNKKLGDLFNKHAEIKDIFKEFDRKVPMTSAIMWAARGKLFDDLICEFIKDHTNTAVVSLGCGVETSFFRAERKPENWYDLDLPEVIKIKEKFIGCHEGLNI